MRTLGLDIGSKRIGLAVSDPSRQIAQPLTVVERKPDGSELAELKRLVEEYEISEIVVGLPLTMQGNLGPQAKEVTDYIDLLAQGLALPIRVWDERLTTLLADRSLSEAGAKITKRKRAVDKIAASIILQGYLDSKRLEESSAADEQAKGA